jgi:exopolysaccharide biosynthesis polyprenyl glycosylphosphotransferase
LILGAGWAGQTVFQALQQHGRAVYQVVGFIDDDPLKQDRRIIAAGKTESGVDDSGETVQLPPVLGPSSQLLEIVDQEDISTLVLAITSDVSGELYQVLTRCLQREMEILPMPVLYEQLTGKVPVQHIGDHWSVAMPLEHPGTKLVWHAVKRLFDLFWAGLGLVFLAVLFPFLALAIYLDSPGPIFYRQKRMGRNEEIFWVYKFRSMIPDAEQGQAVWAEEEDPRVTRVGKLLRKTHLDEFPQFLNILRGEMSVVGPRPERPEFIEELAEEIPFYRVRLAVKPGMAGWGLIHQGYGASVEDALEKLQYDLYYIKHQSLGLDLYILFRTFWDTISFGGR